MSNTKGTFVVKRFLTLALVCGASAVFASLHAAQENESKSPPERVATSQPATREKKLDRAIPQLKQVKVIEVNEKAKTITVRAKDTIFTFNVEDLKSLPKPGETITIWGDPPGQLGQRMVCHLCYCPPPGAAGPCNLCCFDYQILRMTGKVTRLDDRAATFAVTANGRAITFHASKLNALPKVGEVIDVTYTQTPGGPMEATRMTLCSAGCVKRPGGCICP